MRWRLRADVGFNGSDGPIGPVAKEPDASSARAAPRATRRRPDLGGLGSALVTTLLNVRYLTGFTGSAGALLVHADGSAEIATDSRYELQVAQECPDVPARITRSGRPRAGSQRRRIRAASRSGSRTFHWTWPAGVTCLSGVEWTPLGGASATTCG